MPFDADMKNLYLIKLGGSLITDKTRAFTARPETIERLCREIHEVRQARPQLRLIVCHGSGSYGHVTAQRFGTAQGLIHDQSLRGWSEVQDVAARLNRLVISAFLRAEENVISLQPSACCAAENGAIKKFYLTPLRKFLALNLLPVLYGDAVLDIRKGCTILSSEIILAHLAQALRAQKIILCGITHGVLDAQGATIPKISPSDLPNIQNILGPSAGIDVSGGMRHKVQTMIELAKNGTDSLIINGNTPGALRQALLGQKIISTQICLK